MIDITLDESSIDYLFKIILNRPVDAAALDFYVSRWIPRRKTTLQFARHLLESKEFDVNRLCGREFLPLNDKIDYLIDVHNADGEEIDSSIPTNNPFFTSDIFRVVKGKIIEGPFTFVQKELQLGEELLVEYRCDVKLRRINRKKPFLVICIKDFSNLLAYTLKNLIRFKAEDFTNILVIDDRSSTGDVRDVADVFDVSYIRMDNDKGYNYSVMMNFASAIANNYGSDRIVFWNSDMWIDEDSFFERAFKLHTDNNSTISGVKLLFPDFAWNDTYVLDPKKSGRVQFGGPYIGFGESSAVFGHRDTLEDKTYSFVNRNSRELFVTGAFCIMSLKWLVGVGGFNPSLSKVYNDVDICLRAVASGRKVFYFGENIHLYHAESVVLSANDKFDRQFRSDMEMQRTLWSADVVKKLLDSIPGVNHL